MRLTNLTSHWRKFGKECDIAVITRSEAGSTIVSGDQTIHVAADPVATVVDTTGAGDLYAAGFLFGQVRGLDLETCGRLGSLAAAEVISHVRPQRALSELEQASCHERQRTTTHCCRSSAGA